MAVDNRYMLAPALQHLFRDKDTGKPLSFGKVFFYRDIARTILKPVFQLTGFPPNYSYVQVPTNVDGSISLNSVGAFENAIYYFPFDENGNSDLYYIEIFATDVNQNPTFLQFTREGYPTFTSEDQAEPNETNFISNGKFLLHRDFDPDGTVPFNDNEIAYGGWSYDLNVSGAVTDKVLFNRFNAFSSNPPDNPRYAVNIISNTIHSGSGYKQLREKFFNVNRFSSTNSNDKYTFGFYAKTNSSATTISLSIVKFYGTGGSPSPSEIIPLTDSATLSTSYTKYSFSIHFGDNISKNIGTNNDDYVQIAIDLPIDETFDVELTDFFLIEGEKLDEDFVTTTNRTDIMTALGGGIQVPQYDDSNLGLSIVLGEQGFLFNISEIGQVRMTVSTIPSFGYLLCDGSRYETAGKSLDGIPYRRLKERLYDLTNEYPRFGTGPEYFISFKTDPAKLNIANNNPGIVTAASDGVIPTGFTIKMISDGFSGGTNLRAVTEFDIFGSFTVLLLQGTIIGSTTEWGSLVGVTSFFEEVVNIFNTFIVNRIIFESGALMTPSTPLPFYTVNTANGADVNYNVWFQVDGAGALPAVSNPIRVDVDSTDNSERVGEKAAIAMEGKAQVLISTTAGNTITAGSYFTVYAATNSGEQPYYIWYRIDGSGPDPQPGGQIGIMVDISVADTADEVCLKTKAAINSKFFAVPDLRGRFIRGWDNGSFNDIGANSRYNTKVPFMPGDFIGNEQRDEVIIHQHEYSTIAPSSGSMTGVGDPDDVDTFFTDPYPDPALSIDGNEVRPKNIALNYIIKY